MGTPKFDNRKKIDFFKTIIDFWKKTKLTSLVRVRGGFRVMLWIGWYMQKKNEKDHLVSKS